MQKNATKHTKLHFADAKTISYFSERIFSTYRICVIMMPLLIKPPPLQNLIKIQISRHLFAQKSTFWGFFEQKLKKFPSHFNKPPPKNPNFFIDRRHGIDADRVV